VTSGDSDDPKTATAELEPIATQSPAAIAPVVHRAAVSTMSAMTPEFRETVSPIVEAPRAWWAAVEDIPSLLETLHPQLWSTETFDQALQRAAGHVLSLDQRRSTRTPSQHAQPPAQTVDGTGPDGPDPLLSHDAPSGGTSGFAGGAAPMLLAVLSAALAAMAQATRALVRPRFSSRSVALVLVVERPG
jgi:hypothetical protein